MWLDEYELTVGDSLRRSIDHGLTESRFGVVILSPEFFRKEWPQKELDGLVARDDGRTKVILPVWHKVGREDITRYSPTLADKLAACTEDGLEYVADRLVWAMSRGQMSAPNLMIASTREPLRVQDIGRALLTAPPRDLQRIRYEVEEYLSKYPNDVEGRLLHDRVKLAIARELRELTRAPSYSSSRIFEPLWVQWLVIGIWIICLLYFIVRWLLSLFSIGWIIAGAIVLSVITYTAWRWYKEGEFPWPLTGPPPSAGSV